jgi:large subunit ribosomal protein L18e
MKQISKTQITKRLQKKTNPDVVETIKLAKKKGLLELAKKLSAPRAQHKKINLEEINQLKEDKIIIVGKVLGNGILESKKQIIALGFSEQALEKLKKAGCDIRTIKQEIENNKSLEGVKIL